MVRDAGRSVASVEVRVAIDGELDVGTIAPLRDLLVRLREARAPVVVDLAGVTFMDSSAVNLLWRASASGVRVQRPTGVAARVLELSGVPPALIH